MKKISCVGFHATGSGAVDDFLREFDNIETANYGIECRFLQDPDGISDLEYNLIENPHRLNSGYALKRFIKFAKAEERTYQHIFGKAWINWAERYVSKLTEITYKGYWHADIRLVNGFSLFVYKFRRFINKLLPKKYRKNKYYNYFPDINTFVPISNKESFLKITQESCEELCKLLNKSGKEYVVLDQVVSPQNTDRYLKYIDDLKVIIVDRDPRDVYLNDIVINKDFVLPKDIENFCKVYKNSRISIQSPNPNVLRINFEDIIYKYDETILKIMKFLDLKEKNHIRKKEFFNPDISKKNTKIWERYKNYDKEVKYIEEHLADYLYIYK